MLLTFALVVLLGAILIFFSQEFGRTFKKLFAIKGAKLFIPLFIASWLIYSFGFLFLVVIFYLRELMREAYIYLLRFLPFQYGAEQVALVILLTAFSVVPVIILDIISRRNHYVGYKFPYLTSSIIWIVSVFLLIII